MSSKLYFQEENCAKCLFLKLPNSWHDIFEVTYKFCDIPVTCTKGQKKRNGSSVPHGLLQGSLIASNGFRWKTVQNAFFRGFVSLMRWYLRWHRVIQKKLLHKSEEKMQEKMKMIVQKDENLVHIVIQQQYSVSFNKKVDSKSGVF